MSWFARSSELARRAPVAALLLAACAPLPPGSEPIPASRPGLSDDPALVAPGSLQAEAGFDHARVSGAGGEGAAELLVRYGLTGRVEARLGLESASSPAAGGGRTTRIEDLEVGLKLGLTSGEAGALAPMATLVLAATLPTGASAVSAGGIQPAATMLLGWELPGGAELTANVGAARVREDDGRATELFLAAVAGLQLDERVAIEAEYVRVAPVGGGEGGLHHAAAGVGVLVNPDLHLDAWTGWVRRDGSRAVLVGVGISRRWAIGRRGPDG